MTQSSSRETRDVSSPEIRNGSGDILQPAVSHDGVVQLYPGQMLNGEILREPLARKLLEEDFIKCESPDAKGLRFSNNAFDAERYANTSCKLGKKRNPSLQHLAADEDLARLVMGTRPAIQVLSDAVPTYVRLPEAAHDTLVSKNESSLLPGGSTLTIGDSSQAVVLKMQNYSPLLHLNGLEPQPASDIRRTHCG